MDDHSFYSFYFIRKTVTVEVPLHSIIRRRHHKKSYSEGKERSKYCTTADSLCIIVTNKHKHIRQTHQQTTRMSKEFSELDIQQLAIEEDLTDDESEGNHTANSTHTHNNENENEEDVEPDSGHVNSTTSTGDTPKTANTTPTKKHDTTTSSTPLTKKQQQQLQDRKRRIKKLGQRAASLKFRAADFVALSPDKLKQHYKIGTLKHRGGSHKTPEALRSSFSRSVSYGIGPHHHGGGGAGGAGGMTANSSAHSSGSYYYQQHSHANVHECLHRDTGIKRAVKVEKKVPRWMNASSSSSSSGGRNRVVQEFQILQTLDHPSLLRAYELFEGQDHYYMILDLCEGGDLCQELDAWGGLAEPDAARLMRQLLSVLRYCHANRIVHANIKPEHILLEHDKDLDHIRLTDFSCAVLLDDDEDDDDKDKEEEENDNDNDDDSDDDNITGTKSFGGDTDDDDDDENDDNDNDDSESSSLQQPKQQTQKRKIMPERKGTPEFWAPEVVLQGSTSPKRDVWACGVLCYLILSNTFPFRGDTREDICEKIIRGEFSFCDGDSNDDDDDEPCTGSGGNSRANSNDADDSNRNLLRHHHIHHHKENDDDSIGIVNFGSTSFYADYLEDDDVEDDHDKSFDWSSVSEDAKDFIRQLLTYDEKARPTARQALQHPWIAHTTTQQDPHEQRPSARFSNDASAAKTPSGSQFVNSLATMAAWNNVAKFNAQSKLKQATLTFIAAQMVLKEERKAIDHVFRALDTKQDGKLSRSEVSKGYQECFHRELTETELDDLFERVDLNKTGYIEYRYVIIILRGRSVIVYYDGGDTIQYR